MTELEKIAKNMMRENPQWSPASIGSALLKSIGRRPLAVVLKVWKEQVEQEYQRRAA